MNGELFPQCAVVTDAGQFVEPVAAFDWISRTGEWSAIAFAIRVVAAMANAREAEFGLFTNDGNVIAVDVHGIKKRAAAIRERIGTIAAEHL